jgi:hypothetical protein
LAKFEPRKKKPAFEDVLYYSEMAEYGLKRKYRHCLQNDESSSFVQRWDCFLLFDKSLFDVK